MRRPQCGLLGALILAGCSASDQEASVPQNTTSTIVSQKMEPVSFDESCNPFVTVKGEKIGIAIDETKREGRTEYLVTESVDSNGRTVISFK